MVGQPAILRALKQRGLSRVLPSRRSSAGTSDVSILHYLEQNAEMFHNMIPEVSIGSTVNHDPS
jgi:hypothetical protein